MSRHDQRFFDVESSLPVDVTLPERRRERCPIRRRHTRILAAVTVLFVVGCAVMALLAVRALSPAAYGPRCTEDMACWQPAVMGNGRGHVSPFTIVVDR